MKRLVLAIMLTLAIRASADEPTELYDCIDDADGPTFCSDSTAVLVDQGCDATFNRYRGRIAWPVLRNVGPVRIAVKSLKVTYKRSHLPLYVEVRGRTEPSDPKDCNTRLAGDLVLVAQGGTDCGGAWESVGPIDLLSFGVPMGALYTVQVVFFESLPDGYGDYYFVSDGFSCLQVTSHPDAVVAMTWTNVKVLYRE